MPMGKIKKSNTFIGSYFPEDNGHSLVDTIKIDDIDDNDESFFTFYESTHLLDIQNRNNGEVNALYDIFVYDKSNILVFQSKIQDNTTIYRVVLCLDGKIFFRPIGCDVEKNYKLCVINNSVMIMK